jgi:fido (protein-threonine AMPylation protein)
MPISAIEPALPTLAPDLIAEADAVIGAVRRLDGLTDGGLEHVVRPLFRAAHVHHSLYIEDRPSTLAELARASVPAVRSDRARDREADLRASLAVMSWLHEGAGRAHALRAPTDVALVRDIHRRFYAELPASEREVRFADTGRVIDVAPGEWRTEDVTVGRHAAPRATEVDALMRHWSARYTPARGVTAGTALIAAVASHHRLLFVHPFRDGNGRVARLALEASLIALGLDAKGAWTPARGFARARAGYYDALAGADDERWHDAEGRGDRSMPGLVRWCRSVLRVMREQADFVATLLAPNVWRMRLRHALTGPTGRAVDAEYRLVAAAWELGPLPRAALARESGVPPRSVSRLCNSLIERGWLRAVTGDDRRSAPVVGAMPIESARIVFPGLFLDG